MSAGASAGAGAAVAHANLVQAVRASGVLVEVKPSVLLDLLYAGEQPLVVHTYGGWLRKSHKYLTPYRGLAFYAKSEAELTLPAGCEVVESGKMWMPQ
ncbi:MAG: hypothetical protein AAGI68_02040 [Planctomycetota bacterium]